MIWGSQAQAFEGFITSNSQEGQQGRLMSWAFSKDRGERPTVACHLFPRHAAKAPRALLNPIARSRPALGEPCMNPAKKRIPTGWAATPLGGKWVLGAGLKLVKDNKKGITGHLVPYWVSHSQTMVCAPSTLVIIWPNR